MTPLKHVASVRISNVDKKIYEGERPVRLCNYTDVYYGDTIKAGSGVFMAASASRDQIRNFRLQPGDTVLTKDSETPDDVGVSAYIDSSASDFVCGYHLAVVRPDPQVLHPKYLTWSLRSTAVRQQLVVAATGVTRYGLRAEALANVELELPPLDEQRRIADFLDVQVGLLDRVIRLRHKQAELLAARTRALAETHVQQLLAVVPLVRVQRVLHELDIRLSDHAEQERLPLLSVSIHLGVVPRSEVADSEGRAEDYTHYKTCSPGDIVLNRMRAFHGGIGVARQAGLVSPDYTVMRLHENVRPEYLNLIFRSPWFVGQMTQRLRGIGAVDQGAVRTPRINFADLRLIEIPVPSLTQQDLIVVQLRAVEDRSRTARAALDRSSQLLQERKQALIAAAVSGQLHISMVKDVG